MAGFEVEKGELREKSAVFSNGEKRRESSRRTLQNGLLSLLRSGIAGNGEFAQVPLFDEDSRNEIARQWVKPLTGYGKCNGRASRGGSEPFSGVLQSLTRDLFKIQPPGEWKTVVFYF